MAVRHQADWRPQRPHLAGAGSGFLSGISAGGCTELSGDDELVRVLLAEQSRVSGSPRLTLFGGIP